MHILDYITIGIALAFAVSLIAAYAFGSLPLPPERCDRCYQGGGKRLWALAGCTSAAAFNLSFGGFARLRVQVDPRLAF